MIPEGEVGCKICEKSISRIFVEHIEEHLSEKKCVIKDSEIYLLRDWYDRHCDDYRTMCRDELDALSKILTLYEDKK